MAVVHLLGKTSLFVVANTEEGRKELGKIFEPFKVLVLHHSRGVEGRVILMPGKTLKTIKNNLWRGPMNGSHV